MSLAYIMETPLQLKLFVLFMGGFLLMIPPLVGLPAASERPFMLPVYLFTVWGILILLAARIISGHSSR